MSWNWLTVNTRRWTEFQLVFLLFIFDEKRERARRRKEFDERKDRCTASSCSLLFSDVNFACSRWTSATLKFTIDLIFIENVFELQIKRHFLIAQVALSLISPTSIEQIAVKDDLIFKRCSGMGNNNGLLIRLSNSTERRKRRKEMRRSEQEII